MHTSDSRVGAGKIGPDRTGTAGVSDVDFRDWLIFCGLATVGTAVVVLANPVDTITSAAISASLVVALQVVYWFLARPSVAGVRKDSWQAWTYSAIALVVFSAAVVLNPWASLGLFALCPEIFLLLRPTTAAIAGILINALPLAFRLASGTVSMPDAVQLIGTTVFTVAFAIFFSARMLAVTSESEERRKLIDELHEREAEVAALSAARGAGAERARIAREMHDTLAQGFTSIIALGHAVAAELETEPDAARRHVTLITDTAQENLTESRRIIAALSPARLEDASLPDALRRIAAGFHDETGVTTDFVLDGTALIAPAGIEVVLLRVAQECLANVRKHAKAAHVDIVLSYTDAVTALTVVDDGIGFDPAAATPGYGLAGMRARVAEAGGELEVSSVSGGGTSVRAVIPLAAAVGSVSPAPSALAPSTEETS
ncbi:MAG TPA: sensor histidine kinase [Humibacter sp.]|nr:sensor histidine kinase [Humibacter sp.]